MVNGLKGTAFHTLIDKFCLDRAMVIYTVCIFYNRYVNGNLKTVHCGGMFSTDLRQTMAQAISATNEEKVSRINVELNN